MKFIVGILCAGLLSAQTPQFEVASIKPAPPVTALAAQMQAGKLHVGMNIDGARVDIGFMSLQDLLAAAYKVKQFQISGPDWLRQERFDILAKIPEGANKDQVPEMLQALLAERFKLTLHRENKEQPVYALVVGRNGLKMKESDSAEEAPAAPGGRGQLTFGTGDGQVTVQQSGRGAVITGARPGTGPVKMTMGQNGAMRMEMSKVTMTALADMLGQFVDRPVVDMTELKGSYQAALEVPMEELLNRARALAPGLGIPVPGGPGGNVAGAGAAPTGLAAADPSGSSIFQAVQALGLRLDARKAPVETIIIDRAEKSPTEN